MCATYQVVFIYELYQFGTAGHTQTCKLVATCLYNNDRPKTDICSKSACFISGAKHQLACNFTDKSIKYAGETLIISLTITFNATPMLIKSTYHRSLAT